MKRRRLAFAIVILLAGIFAAANVPALADPSVLVGHSGKIGEAEEEGNVMNMANEINFSYDKFVEPDAIYWPGYFWMWNGPLDADVLLKQLRDMKEHDARSVCVLPMPREFRPDSTNNQMDVTYLSPEFFQRAKVVVEEAKRLGMNYWLYDEGGWPSGGACGQVTKDHPELQASVMRLKENGEWRIEKGGGVDRLNPKATQRFINLTHDGYENAVGEYFGKTILFAFTDEPGAGRVSPGDQIPWTEGLGDDFEKQFGYRVEERLNAFEKSPDELTPEDMRVRVDFFDCWSKRFVDAYFKEIKRWCHEHGILSVGHLGGEDETMGSIKHGYGHILRVLRAMDLPGVDVIWRQIFQGQSNHHFPLYASTAAHQIGSPYAFTESLCVYGNGLTFQQMKWITDYQYVRGINLMVLGCYSLSTQDHLMCGERPHFGPINPLWDHIPAFHGYVARLGYALSCGQPAVETALYFPVRDMWARGIREEAVDGYETLVDALSGNQCGFNLIDDDVLTDTETHIEEGVCRVGPMAYGRILFPPCAWLKQDAVARLAEFVRSGGHLFCLEQWPGTDGDNGEYFSALLDEQSKKRVYVFDSVDELVQRIPSLVRLEPICDSIRVTVRELENGSIYFLWNEGSNAFDGSAYFHEPGPVNELNPHTSMVSALQKAYRAKEGTILPLHLDSGASMLLMFGGITAEKRPIWEETATLPLTDGWQARAIRQFDIGEHDYEIREIRGKGESINLGPWRERFSEDFSGDVAYHISVSLPKEWRGCSLKLELGHVEYVARVCVNGISIGNVIWSPWEISLPEKVETESLELEIVVTNTLANLLTSERVRNDWQNRKGPGWPGPYDARAAEFEKESRGGGLYGPVQLKVGHWQEP